MKLPDFLEFESFNKMRELVGTDKLGYFEFFDPATQLTGEERSELSRTGVITKGRYVRLLSDHSLGYKNSRIVILDGNKAHLTYCQDIKLLEEFNLAIPGKILNDYKPCHQCLHDLRYKGFDMQRERKKAHSEYVLQQFTFDQYFSMKPLYPVSCVELTIKFLRDS